VTTSWYSPAELADLGFASFGQGLRISRFARIYGPDRITIGDHVRIDDFSILSAAEPMRIGRNVHIAAFCGLFGAAGLELGDFSGLSSRVSIYTVSEDYSGASLTNPTVPEAFRTVEAAPIRLGRHAIVGAGAVILPGASLGDGAAVGSLSLVSRPIPAWSIAVGVPARVVKERRRDLLERERVYLAGDGQTRRPGDELAA
jgi:galactoside O-acetyltransferase